MATAARPARFTYWSGPDPGAIAPMTAEWQAAFADFTIIGDAEIRPLLEKRHPRLAPLYQRLRIPAARSDIARLAWLEAHGGFYVDAHAGLRDEALLRRLLDTLPEGGVALVDKNPKVRPEGELANLWPRNGAIFARREAPFLTTALAAVTDRLSAHDRAPDTPTSIWEISGPGLFIALLRDPAAPTQIVPRWQASVRILDRDSAPVRFYVHKGYRDKAQHWSARERHEALLDPPGTV